MAIEGANRLKTAPAFLRRHPALWVEWLRVANSFSRWRGEGSQAALLFLCGSAVVIALLVVVSGHVVSAIQSLSEYWVLLAVVAAIYSVTSVGGRRRQLEESRSQSWLIATPIPPGSLLISQAIRVFLPLFFLLVAAVMFPALIALTNEGVTAAAEKVAGAAAGGLFLGGVVGWYTGRRANPSGVVPSRYVPQPRTDRAMRPDAAGLSGWPIAQVLAWSRPENSRYVLVAALLAVQGGSSALTGLAVVGMYLVASYLAALLSAMTAVAKSAALWLRATPITLMGFAWSVSRRALAHQLIGVALAIMCTLLLGSPISMALQVAGLWLGLFISISGFALLDNYRGRSPLIKIALTVAAFAALATVFQLRAGAKT